MGMIRRADLEQCAQNSYVMDLGDLGRHAEEMIQNAREQAARIVADAQAERDRLLGNAEREGRDAGYAEGHAAGHAEGLDKGVTEAREAQAQTLRKAGDAWTAALDAFEAERDAMIQSARAEIVRLAAEIAARVTRRAVDLDPATVLAQMEAVLGAVTGPSRLVLRVHPDDLDLSRAELPSIVARFDLCRHAELVSDASLARGSCVATTDQGGRIDADIEHQLARIIAGLLPDDEAIRFGQTARGDAA
jgi:flagellar biosynthesis/type III secretory pathway protein FliH